MTLKAIKPDTLDNFIEKVPGLPEGYCFEDLLAITKCGARIKSYFGIVFYFADVPKAEEI